MNFSIIIVTFNRAHLLQKTLRQFKTLDYPIVNYELIIVDNGSTDTTYEVCRQSSTYLAHVRYLYEPHGGQSYARNIGITVATYSYILFLDDDETVPSTILRRYAQAWRRHPNASAIGGGILPILENTGEQIDQSQTHPSYRWVLGEIDHGPKEKRLIYPEVLFGGNMSLHFPRISHQQQVFDTRLGKRVTSNLQLGAEDYELGLRMHLQKKQVIYVPLYVYNTVSPLRLTLWYQFYRCFCAGVERNIIDAKLSHLYQMHTKFSFSIKAALSDGFQLARRKKTDGYFHILHVAFFLGYYSHVLIRFLSITT